MIGSRFDRRSGMGIIPLIIAAATIGAGIYQQKKAKQAAKDAEKEAEDFAKTEAARKKKLALLGASSTRTTVLLAVGGAAALGVGAWLLMRRRR